MARLIAGRIIGKVGDLVYSSRNGINYVKQTPKKSLKPPSEKQLIQWKKFGMVVHFLSPLKKLLNQSYRNPKRSGLHNAVRKNLSESVIGEYPHLEFDYTKVSLISGWLCRLQGEMVYDVRSAELLLCYFCEHGYNSYLNDELIALIYCPELPQYWHQVNTGLQRYEQIGAFKIPTELIGHEMHVWLYFRSQMMGEFSNSVYMGKISTQKDGDL